VTGWPFLPYLSSLLAGVRYLLCLVSSRPFSLSPILTKAKRCLLQPAQLLNSSCPFSSFFAWSYDSHCDSLRYEHSVQRNYSVVRKIHTHHNSYLLGLACLTEHYHSPKPYSPGPETPCRPLVWSLANSYAAGDDSVAMHAGVRSCAGSCRVAVGKCCHVVLYLC
jgi:hypothetical protein